MINWERLGELQRLLRAYFDGRSFGREQAHSTLKMALADHLINMLHRDFGRYLGQEFSFDFQVGVRETSRGTYWFGPRLNSIQTSKPYDPAKDSGRRIFGGNKFDSTPLEQFNDLYMLRPIQAKHYERIQEICDLCFAIEPHFDRYQWGFPLERHSYIRWLRGDVDAYTHCLELISAQADFYLDFEHCKLLVEQVRNDYAAYLEAIVDDCLRGRRVDVTLHVRSETSYNDEGGNLHYLGSISLCGLTSPSLIVSYPDYNEPQVYREVQSLKEVHSLPDQTLPVVSDDALSRHLGINLSTQNAARLVAAIRELRYIRYEQDVALTLAS